MASRRPAKRAIADRPATRDLQAAVEGVPVDPVEVKTVSGEVVAATDAVEFLGVWYRIADRVGLMPLLKYAYAADRGLDSSEMAGMAAMYAMLRDCIHPADWSAFEYAAMDDRDNDGERLLAVVRDANQKILARPTKRPADSSAGPQPTSGRSRESSSATGTRSLPDGLVSVDSLLGRSTG